MYVKLPPGDLNPGPCPSHPTSTYTCGMTTAPRVRNDESMCFKCGRLGHKKESYPYMVHDNTLLKCDKQDTISPQFLGIPLDNESYNEGSIDHVYSPKLRDVNWS